MNVSVRFALKNIRRYRKSALGRGIILVFLTFAVVLAFMFSLTMTDALSGILNARKSCNMIWLSIDKGEKESIAGLPFVNEVTEFPKNTPVNGNLEIEGAGTFWTNAEIFKASETKYLFSETFLEEFHSISEEPLMVAGRLPEKNNEVILDADFLEEYGISDYSALLGKKLTFIQEIFDKKFYLIEDAVIVGVHSGELLDIAGLEYCEDCACCWLLDEECTNDTGLYVFCDYENLDEAFETLSAQYSGHKVVNCSDTTFAFDKLEEITSFLRKILALVCLIIGMVYVVVQIVTVMNYLQEKEDFVTAIRAFGLKKRNLVLVFLFEYLFVSLIPFVLSGALAVPATRAAARFMSVLTGIRFTPSVSILPIAIAFAVVLAVTLVTVLAAVRLHKPSGNE